MSYEVSLGGSPGTEVLMLLPLHWNCVLVFPTEHLLCLPRPHLSSFWSPIRSHSVSGSCQPPTSPSLPPSLCPRPPRIPGWVICVLWLHLTTHPSPGSLPHLCQGIFHMCVCVCVLYVWSVCVFFICVCVHTWSPCLVWSHHPHRLVPNAGPPTLPRSRIQPLLNLKENLLKKKNK